MTRITRKRARVLKKIHRHFIVYGWAPTVRELREDLGYTSNNPVWRWLKVLEKDGMIKRGNKHEARALALTPKGLSAIGK